MSTPALLLIEDDRDSVDVTVHALHKAGLRIELPLSAPVGVGRLLNVHVGLSSSGESLANRRQMIPARVVWIDRKNNILRLASVREGSGAFAETIRFTEDTLIAWRLVQR